MAVYIVQPGDSLWRISQQYGLSISQIKTINGLTSDRLVPGLPLYFPDSMPTRFYKIKPGDTLWRLAQQFSVSWPVIVQANPGLDPSSLAIGQIIKIPSPLKYKLRTLAFTDAYYSADIVSKISSLSPLLSYLAVVAYSVQSDGTLNTFNDDTLIKTIKESMIAPLMVVANTTSGGIFDKDLAGTVLSPSVRPQLVQSIVQTARAKGYAGVSLDFEFIPPTNRSNYTLFLQELKQALGGLILQVNVPSKTEDLPDNPIVGAVDYAAVGQIADIITVLTYDYGYPTGPPDPISPAWWVDQVLQYATRLIPNKKLMMGIPFYGYDWNTETLQTTALSANAAQNFSLDHYIPIQYDQQQESPYLSYYTNNTKHTIWFEGPRSLQSKYRVLESDELLGVAYWKLGFDFPQNWAYLQTNFSVVK